MLADLIRFMFPGADLFDAVHVTSDDDGERVTRWTLDEPQPTAAELDAVADSQQFAEWREKEYAPETAAARAALATLDEPGGGLSVVIDELLAELLTEQHKNKPTRNAKKIKADIAKRLELRANRPNAR